ncbi:MAG TPA: hypothetical protein EYP52_02300 [Anaerolineae bacterium]|nr:hypothetical protein [Anaerolineae bacterium]
MPPGFFILHRSGAELGSRRVARCLHQFADGRTVFPIPAGPWKATGAADRNVLVAASTSSFRFSRSEKGRGWRRTGVERGRGWGCWPGAAM